MRYDSAATPLLCKLVGFILGDGSIHFESASGQGIVSFFGKPADLETIRRDCLRLGLSPSRIYSRERQHLIRTGYGEYRCQHTGHHFKVSSRALAWLLVYLGVPHGKKATQDYTAPAWLEHAPLWQKRLFLAAFFGAEMTTPQMVSGHAYNLAAPVVSINKREEQAASGRAFLAQIARWLQAFGVQSQADCTATRTIACRRPALDPPASGSGGNTRQSDQTVGTRGL